MSEGDLAAVPFSYQGLSRAQAVRRLCAAAFGVAEADLIGRSRARRFTGPRQLTCYVLRRRFPELSYPTIGRLMAPQDKPRDHSTIIHAVGVAEWRIERDPELAGIVAALIGTPLRTSYLDAHVMQWRAHCAALRQCNALVRNSTARARRAPVDPEGELAEFLEQDDLLWCGQCDRAVRDGERRACQSRFCPLRAKVAA